jgi:hypothetical protein
MTKIVSILIEILLEVLRALNTRSAKSLTGRGLSSLFKKEHP